MPDPARLQLGLIQTAVPGSPEDALAHTVDRIRTAAQQGAQVIATQELFLTPYFCKIQNPDFFDFAESVPGPTTEALGKVAAELGVVIVASLFERRAEGLYHNTAAVLDADGAYLGKYRKMHIPQDPGFEEKFYFTPGDLGHQVFATRFGRIGVLICWDQWYPEAARLTALRGADVLLYPTAIGWLPLEKDELGAAQYRAWETINRSHAIANGCYVAAINRIGTEQVDPDAEPTEFWGQSFVADPYGEIIAQAPPSDEGILVTELDLAKLRDFRRIWPFFRDRRIDAYGDLTQRFLDSP